MKEQNDLDGLKAVNAIVQLVCGAILVYAGLNLLLL